MIKSLFFGLTKFLHLMENILSKIREVRTPNSLSSSICLL